MPQWSTKINCAMKFILAPFIITFVLLLASCQQNSGDDQHESHDLSERGPNQELYDEVMSVHDEVMPKMNDLHKAKTSLQTRLGLPGVNEFEKQEIGRKIARIDSASEGMMIWMRQFEPLSDSQVGEDSARAYLELELQKVKKVRADIHQALQAVE